MDVKSNLNLYSWLKFEKNFTEFPEEPELGTVILKDNRLYIYELVDMQPTWSTLTGQINNMVYIHEQLEESDTWTINHNHNSTTYLYDIVDSTGRHILANMTSEPDGNTITVKFNKPYSGKATLLFVKEQNSSKAKNMALNYNSKIKKIDNGGIYDATNNDCFIINSLSLSEDVIINLKKEINSNITIKNHISGNYKVIIKTTDGACIDGKSEIELLEGSSVSVICDNDDWYIISGYIRGE